ncbi:MAG TPA: NTPase, partial [Methanosarcina sp.]|nr:NTPase [Methanosarcina sp.]
MREDRQKTYAFNLLTDEIVDDDFFEDKTHENVAETLHKLIDSNDNGFTIGLEGSWGSGKSTVISILKKKLNNSSFHYFYFDAWAHEGDHLRRIFLESLISQLDVESEKLKELKEEISNRKRTTITNTKQYGTKLGKYLAASL